jgi:uncharacterized protein YukE
MTSPSDTRLGGDSASMRAVAAWFRDTLAVRVESAVSAVAHIQRARLESWDDAAGRAFAARLASGHSKMAAFAAAIRRRADLLDEIADVLATAEARMAEADRLAELNHLRKEGGWIYAPMLGESIDDQPENNTPEALNGYYTARREIYREVEELVEGAYAKVHEKLVGDQSYDWNQLTFIAGDLVKENASELVHQHDAHHSSAVALLLAERPTPPPVLAGPRPYGLTARVLTAGGPILTLTGAAYDLYSGSPPQRVVLTTGVGIGAGTAGLWLIRAFTSSPPAWLAAVVVTAASFGLAELAGGWYDHNRTAREKLLDIAPTVESARRELPG